MKEINFAKSIIELRKRKGVTQEEMAAALHISPQAVSKWETGANQPDTQSLGAIADFFHVSLDYLFYNETRICDDFYATVTEKVSALPMMSKASYEEALRIFASAHHGISQKNLVSDDEKLPYEAPAHISNENGLSLLSGRGYGAIVTRDFFSFIDEESIAFAASLFRKLSEPNVLPVLSAVISMSDISLPELCEKLPQLKETELTAAIEKLKEVKLLDEKPSKHKSLGKTYTIPQFFHTCLCLLLATAEMQRFSLKGVACCMGPGDYPIRFGKAED